MDEAHVTPATLDEFRTAVELEAATRRIRDTVKARNPHVTGTRNPTIVTASLNLVTATRAYTDAVYARLSTEDKLEAMRIFRTTDRDLF